MANHETEQRPELPGLWFLSFMLEKILNPLFKLATYNLQLTTIFQTMSSTKNTLTLPRPLVNKILAHAQQNPEIEVCGLIGNSASNQKNYYPVDNVANKPDCRFLMDGSQQINAIKKMRDKQQQLYAIVHSHPHTQATPSQLDIDESSYKDVYYLIISLNTKGVLEIRAYTQQQKSMQEVNLILETDG